MKRPATDRDTLYSIVIVDVESDEVQLLHEAPVAYDDCRTRHNRRPLSLPGRGNTPIHDLGRGILVLDVHESDHSDLSNAGLFCELPQRPEPCPI